MTKVYILLECDYGEGAEVKEVFAESAKDKELYKLTLLI